MKLVVNLLLLLALLMAACTPVSTTTPTSSGPRTLTVMTHDSFAVSEEVVAAFEAQYNARLEFRSAGDTGTALNKAILAKGAPLADVFYGVDNTFLSRALKEDIFIPYASPLLTEIPESFQIDPAHLLLPVDYGDVCLNIDLEYFEKHTLAIPTTLDDLLKPEYAGLLVVTNPATSSPGLAFMMATIARYGDPQYLDFWQALRQNDLKVVNDWESAYYTEFTRAGGMYPIVLSYASSPAFEVIYAETPQETPPTAAITSAGTCFRQIEFVGILQGTPNQDLAEKWLDFMLSKRFQEDMPLQMFVFPVNQQAQLDERFSQFLVIPDQPASLPYEEIAAKRETWIQAWTEIVLR
jgi:thiamine transport system substrate-binding protein